MLFITVWGIAMGILSAIFWGMELSPFIKAVKILPPMKESKNPITNACEGITYIIRLVRTCTKLWGVALDVLSTFCVTGILGFSGLVGGVIGLTASNVISIYILIEMKKANV